MVDLQAFGLAFFGMKLSGKAIAPTNPTYKRIAVIGLAPDEFPTIRNDMVTVDKIKLCCRADPFE